MPARRIVCPDCGESVPRGRLSCPACGALLASVAGGVVRPAGNATGDAPDVQAPDVQAPEDQPPSLDPSAMTPARIQTQALPEPSADDAQAAAGQASPVERGPATPMSPSSIRQTELESPAPAAAASTVAAVATEGGYLPPGTSPPAQTFTDPAPMAPTSPALPPSAADGASPSNSPSGVQRTSDPARLDQALGYATAAGSGLVAFGMLMPWSASVIGASGVSGFFDTWGLAGPAHILFFLWALVVLAVSVLPTRIPVSIRSGLAGLLLGVFCLGLVWPYVIGPLGAGIGVLVVTVGALVLTATGIASAWRDRHAADDRAV